MNEVIHKLNSIHYRQDRNGASPHKFAFLLALAKLYEINPLRENRFCITDELESYYRKYIIDLSPDIDEKSSIIEYPFYHLQTDGFWYLHIYAGKNKEYEEIAKSSHMRFTKKRLIEIVEYASLQDSFDSYLRNELNRGKYMMEIRRLYASANTIGKDKGDMNSDSTMVSEPYCSNQFVSYLRSLQRIEAYNENSIAESQSCNPFFPFIQVCHPLSQIISSNLTQDGGKHVILTGHAGDGKSTIAFEIFKQLKGIPLDRPFVEQLKPREEIEKYNISIIKDLSEHSRNEDAQLLQQLVNNEKMFLIVSNTGTLLALFRNNANLWAKDEIEIEDEVLRAMSHESGVASLELGQTQFIIYNLARMENLDIAKQIFDKMLVSERWLECEKHNCRITCPIYTNVHLIQQNKDRICDRIFLAYRRMYEYGTRLTLRQLTEHLSYMITSGIEEDDFQELRNGNKDSITPKYMFFNRFFGDDGRYRHKTAQQMQAIREIHKQGFGSRICPTWERRLWHRSHGQEVQLGITGYEEEFQLLRKIGSGQRVIDRPRLSSEQARDQVRRMIYFLYDFTKDDNDYICHYLNSPSILKWQNWQTPAARIDSNEKFILEERIYHVLQEHFTGVRLPEGSAQSDRRLYVTLNRRRNEIRQSAQIVLAQIDWSTSVQLTLDSLECIPGRKRTDLYLKGLNVISGVNLLLTLPFLDYVVMRHFGELGELLQAAYSHRLERFKAQIQKLARVPDERILLVRLKTDHTFRRQFYTISNGKLEVIDVL